MFAIVTTEVLRNKAFYELHRWAICAALLAMGVLLLVVGKFVNANIRESQRNDPDGPTGPFILVNLQYWGLILAIYAILVAIIVPDSPVAAREAVLKAVAPLRRTHPHQWSFRS
ncbi:MAG TPA: hypothetical protein VK615_06075 [Candidatus Binatia bacterium]|nr:hypothetical protein [Candidatus Binatia bacterium]